MTESEVKTIDDCINELRKHRNVYLKRSTPWRVVNRALHLIEQYRAIGTVEELKALKEKANTKNWIAEYMVEGEFAWKCPTCDETFVLLDGTPQDNEYNFCPNCGQSLAESKPCCANCRSFYIEYGMELCKHFEEPMEDVNNEKCSDYERY